MILKYELEEKQLLFEENEEIVTTNNFYLNNIKNINKQKARGKNFFTETLIIKYNDETTEELIVNREFTNEVTGNKTYFEITDAWLMNDKGETIDRIV